MKQKILTLFTTLMTFVSAHAIDFWVDGLWFNLLSSTEVEVIGCNESSGAIIIPASVSYQGKTFSVTSIRKGTFEYRSGLTSVEIPNSVLSIGEFAFLDCCGLKSMEIPNSVTSIGNSAFSGCSGLKSVIISNSITSIGEYIFNRCSGLTSVEIPTSVTSIGFCAFASCSGLTSVDIPNSVTKIGNSAFSGCSGLKSVEIPNSVKSIGDGAFYGCSGLKSMEIPNSVTSIGEGSFSSCSGLMSFYGKYASEDNRCLIVDGVLKSFAPADLVTYSIPNSVTSIGGYAFYDCSGLTSVGIPTSVTSIGDYAFSNCWGLTSMEIPNSVKSIGVCAFYECIGLTSVGIPTSVTSIGDYAFTYCLELTSLEIPNSVKSIGEGAFGFTGLTSVEIPNSVTAIGSCAFYGCNLAELKTAWDNPADVQIGKDVFSNTHEITLYVPKGTTKNYKNLSPWKQFKEIKEYTPDGNVVYEKCTDPVISVEDNKLIFTSPTPDAKYNYTIECYDEHFQNNSDDGVVDLRGTYQISVYAYAYGYDNSDIVTATLVWVNPQIEGAGVLSMEAKKAVLIKKADTGIQICGTEPGEIIHLYDINGMLLDSVKATDSETSICGNLQSGQIYIILYGDKSIKYKF